MRLKITYFLLIPALFINGAAVWAQNILADKKIAGNEPVEIVADRMEAFNATRTVVFSGNAVATRGDIKIKTDRLTIYYEKSNKPAGKDATAEVAGSGQLEKIEAKGNVVITRDQVLATGAEAVYRENNATIVLSGNPTLRENQNVIKGCQIIFYINENKGKVEPCPGENSGRVTAIITSGDKK